MGRDRFQSLLVLVFTLVLLVSTGCTFDMYRDDADIACKGCNLVIISLDTLRADRLGTYGNLRDVSPVVDAFGEESLLFENTYSQAPKTAPSHMTMFTSLYPYEHRVCLTTHHSEGCTYVLDEDTALLAEILKAGGYANEAYTGGGHVASTYGFDRGFQAYRDNEPLEEFVQLEDPFGTVLQAAADKPFFLFLHTYITHDPYFPSDEAREMFCPGYEGPVIDTFEKEGEMILERIEQEPLSEFSRTFFDGLVEDLAPVSEPDYFTRQLQSTVEKKFSEESVLKVVGLIRSLVDAGGVYMYPRILMRKTGTSFWFPWRTLDTVRDEVFTDENAQAENLEYLSCLYDAEVYDADTMVATVLDSLDAHGLRENTIIILTSDHGEEFQEHGCWNHEQLYNEILHVPLIVSIPGQEPQRISEPVMLLDLTPTVLDALGFREQDGMKGTSLLNVAQEKNANTLPLYAETYGVRYMVVDVVDGVMYKLIANSRSLEESEKWQLFDLDVDPGEQQNVIEELPEVMAELNLSLMTHANSGYAVDDGERQDMSEEELDKLRSLGYV